MRAQLWIIQRTLSYNTNIRVLSDVRIIAYVRHQGNKPLGLGVRVTFLRAHGWRLETPALHPTQCGASVAPTKSAKPTFVGLVFSPRRWTSRGRCCDPGTARQGKCFNRRNAADANFDAHSFQESQGGLQDRVGFGGHDRLASSSATSTTTARLIVR
jgi:hypothetical protein